MQDHERKRIISLRALSAFPRSFGMLVGAIILAITHDPFVAIIIALVVWLGTYLLVKQLSTSDEYAFDTYLWQFISPCVIVIGAWIAKWFIYIGLLIFSIIQGAPPTTTLIIMGALLLYDMYLVFRYGY
jgi:hypothetical protein